MRPRPSPALRLVSCPAAFTTSRMFFSFISFPAASRSNAAYTYSIFTPFLASLLTFFLSVKEFNAAAWLAALDSKSFYYSRHRGSFALDAEMVGDPVRLRYEGLYRVGVDYADLECSAHRGVERQTRCLLRSSSAFMPSTALLNIDALDEHELTAL